MKCIYTEDWSCGKSAPIPITSVSIFIIDEVNDNFQLSIVKESWFNLPDDSLIEFDKKDLIYVSKYKKWKEYKIKNWNDKSENNFKNWENFKWSYFNDDCSKCGNTFINIDDEYGYYRKNETIPRKCRRIGFSTNEGSNFFVNFLAPPLKWNINNHYEWPKSFKKEVIYVLMICERKRIYKDLKYLLIETLADLHTYDYMKYIYVS